jgi:hypothetical protein
MKERKQYFELTGKYMLAVIELCFSTSLSKLKQVGCQFPSQINVKGKQRNLCSLQEGMTTCSSCCQNYVSALHFPCQSYNMEQLFPYVDRIYILARPCVSTNFSKIKASGMSISLEN